MSEHGSDSMRYLESIEGIEPSHLEGFFQGWRCKPTPQQFLAILGGSSRVVLAWDASSARVVGFINALSDGRLMAFIPLLEVLPAFRGRGIGSALVRRMLTRLNEHYAVDVVCDADVVSFYKRHDLRSGHSMMRRNYEWPQPLANLCEDGTQE